MAADETVREASPRESYEGQTPSSTLVPSQNQGWSLSPTSSRPATSDQKILDPPPEARHQRFVLADPVAFSYLEEDPSTTVLSRRINLQGYQTYIVEQWACSRAHPTFIISAYTGDTSHSVKVGVLSVPANEESWSTRLRVYFKSLTMYHAKRKDTPLGIFMVTNLSTFPSSLTIVLVPEGDLRKHREVFCVAENLKRLGCSGRVGLSIAEPSSATQAKYHQLYKTSDKINLYNSVIELVKLCQVSLVLFGSLGPEYADGILCDVTERAINEWWAQIGTDLYNIEPSDGILGPTTVAALLGTLMGARNRLAAFGAPVSKDVFDIDTTKRAVGHFQKAQRLPRNRRLDRHTLDRLHKATAKQASSDGWTVPKAVKSTVAELSGKGGEMVMEMVGRGDRANIAEIETVDIERFAHLVKGERAQWLWQGKPRKRTTKEMFGEPLEDPDHNLSPPRSRGNDIPSPKETQPVNTRPEIILDQGRPETSNENKQAPRASSKDDFLRPEAESGTAQTAFSKAKGRLKGAVGIRPQQTEKPKDELLKLSAENKSVESVETVDSGPKSQVQDKEKETSTTGNSKVLDGLKASASFTKIITNTPPDSQPDLVDPKPADREPELGAPIDFDRDMLRPSTPARSIIESVNADANIEEFADTGRRKSVGLLLRRTQSLTPYEDEKSYSHKDYRWPRQLSFGAAEEAVLGQSNFDQDLNVERSAGSAKADYDRHRLRASIARHLRNNIEDIDHKTGGWVDKKLAEVENLDALAAQDVETVNGLYYPRKDGYQTLQEGSQDMIAEERIQLQEAVKDVETLGAKLEYEINSLKGKVEDVEAAVDEYERQVVYAESRVRELVSSEAQEGWLAWTGRMMLGIGKKPGTT